MTSNCAVCSDLTRALEFDSRQLRGSPVGGVLSGLQGYCGEERGDMER